MMRLQVFLGAFLLFVSLIGAISRAELSEEEKRKLFLKARERMRTVATPTPEASASPRHKPKPATHPPSKKKKSSRSKAEKEEEKPRRTPPPGPEEKPARTPAATEKQMPERPSESTPPRAPAATPAPTPGSTASAEKSSAPAQVLIQKSGYQKPRGFSLLPFHLFGRHYTYLTRSVRNQIDRAPVLRERWRFIIVHNSGTRQGNARIFDYYHRNVRRMRNGLAYHFVIGNGTSSGNGEIEVGDRWRRQINGGHVHSDYLNNISLGICLVGDFNRDQPTRAQLDSCEELIRYLRARCGKVDRHEIPVRPHREMNPPRWPTDCPGDIFPYRWFGQFR
jgi:N-acetylmuramoyl-L-alanine amidase